MLAPIHKSIAERIAAFNQDREPAFVLFKYRAMRESSFRFLRGTCHLYYEYLHRQHILPPSPPVWICGDLHLENFGSFKGADREVYFDINDFDEGILAPALFELSRLLVSIRVGCRNAGYSPKKIEALLVALTESYRHTLQTGKPVTVEYGTAQGLVKELLEKVMLRKEKKLVKDRTDPETGYSRLLIDNKRSFSLPATLRKELIFEMQEWLDKTRGKNKRRVHDVVFLVAGTGSIGIKRYLALASDTESGKKYLLVIKQALPSSLQPYISLPQPAWPDEATRVNTIGFMMQHATPGGLGVFNFRNVGYTSKWVQPEADKINIAAFMAKPGEQPALMNTLGKLLAAAQLRSGGRQGSAIADELIKFGADNSWTSELFEFVTSCSKQVEQDFAEYSRAYDSGYFDVKNK